MKNNKSIVIQQAMELFGVLISKSNQDELIRVTGYIEGMLAHKDIVTQNTTTE